jgi:signal transduction histidine kinase/NO-binding membrane sensor protein with MHYT domain/AmiR/NasT family two-component response regulator
MYKALLCLQKHDPQLVGLAAAICLFACAASLHAYARAIASTDARYRFAWCGVVAAFLGSGVWATHFVAILAFQKEMIAFDLALTTLSWFIVVIGVGAGALVATHWPGRAGRMIAGVAWGVSIAVMHFVGVAAVRLPATMAWQLPVAVAAVVVGVGFASAALLVAGYARAWNRMLAGAALLSLGIIGLHFTAMAAIRLTPAPMIWEPSAYSRDALVLGLRIFVVMILFAGGGMLAVARFSKAAALAALHHGLDQAPTAMGFFDSGHRLVLWNKAYAEFMGAYGKQVEAGMDWCDIASAQVNATHVDGTPVVRKARSVGSEPLHFGELQMPDGRWMDARLAPTGGGGFVVVLNDVSAHHRLVARETEARKLAEGASRTKSEFLANVSHEIRTPLNAVLGMVQVMGRDRLSKRQRERLDVIDAAGRALLATLNDVLDLTKIEAGKLELETHPFDLDEMVGLTAAAYAPLARQKDLAFAVSIAPEAHGAWVGDSTRLRQVISNLISNAVKFTSTGKVEVLVTRTGNGLAFAIQDTGIGIAPEKLNAIFEKFTQADASMTRRFGGTGLGLAICQQLVELMGGHLEVTSEEGKGACFRFSVPLVRGKERSSAPATERPQEAERPLRVLAAEDNPTNQLILTALLEPLGADLTVVADGREAVDACAAQTFDVILMDAQMPVMNGLEAAIEIRRRESAAQARRTPIIALTANVMQHQLAEYAEAGMDGHVAKPIEAPKLFEAIMAAVEESSDPADAEASAA